MMQKMMTMMMMKRRMMMIENTDDLKGRHHKRQPEIHEDFQTRESGQGFYKHSNDVRADI